MTIHVESPEAITADHARSWLIIAPTSIGALVEASASRADRLVVDLEDGISPELRPAARERVIAWFDDGHHSWVRINAYASQDWAADIAALGAHPGVDGIVLATSEAAEQVEATASGLRGRTPLIPLVESALGIERAFEIARAPGVVRLAFGIGDYRKDTGSAGSALALAYPRSRLVVASRAAGIAAPVDGPALDPLLLDMHCEEGIEQGMTGKLTVQQSQIRTINDRFSPSDADVSWALGVLEGESHTRDGSYAPLAARARTVLARAQRFGRAIDTETQRPRSP